MLSTDVDVIISRNQEKRRQDLVKTWLDDDRRAGLWTKKLSGAVILRKDDKPVDKFKNKWNSPRNNRGWK